VTELLRLTIEDRRPLKTEDRNRRKSEFVQSNACALATQLVVRRETLKNQ